MGTVASSPAVTAPSVVSVHARYSVALALALPAVVYLALAWRYTRTGLWNADEGFYCLAAHRAVSGGVLYRDFGYSQLPLLPYLNGAAMAVTGYGLIAQRAVNAVWGALTLALVVTATARRGTVTMAVVAGVLLAASPGWVQSVCLGKTYAATGLFLTLCGLAATVPSGSRRAALGLSLGYSLCGAAAIGCRLSAAPVVLALWAGGLWVRPRTAATWWSLPASGALLAALVVPFAVMAPESFVFWVLRYHGGSLRDARGWSSLVDLFWLAPGILALVPVAMTALAMEGSLRRRPAAALLTAALVGMAMHTALRTGYAEYSVPLLPLAVIGLVGILAEAHAGRWSRWRAGLGVLPVLALLHPLPRTMVGLEASVAGAVRALRTRTQPGARVLTPVPYLAVEAHRDVVPGTEMGMFALTDTMDDATARRLHLVTPGMLLRALDTGEAGAVTLIGFQSPWNFTWSVPGLQPVDPSVTERMYRTVSARYKLVYRDPRFVVFVRR